MDPATILLVTLLLACPLAMLFMHRGGHGSHGGGHAGHGGGRHAGHGCGHGGHDHGDDAARERPDAKASP